MANMNSGQAPDLQAILATLASFAPPAQQADPPTTQDDPDETAPPHAQQTRTQDPGLQPQRRSMESSKPTIDPASITTWPDGLRCVTKIAAQNAQFAASIRKMMDNQRSNEMRWYAERQALKQSHGLRERASAQANEILKGLGNDQSCDLESDSGAAASHDRDLERELAAFDRKVYSAKTQMEEALTAELKNLGVPFFGTNPSAVLDDSKRHKSADLERAASSRPKHSPLVTETQLLELRRRMVEHLEALYRD